MPHCLQMVYDRLGSLTDNICHGNISHAHHTKAAPCIRILACTAAVLSSSACISDITMKKTWRRRLACSAVRSLNSRSVDAMQMPAPMMGSLPMLSDGTNTCSAAIYSLGSPLSHSPRSHCLKLYDQGQISR